MKKSKKVKLKIKEKIFKPKFNFYFEFSWNIVYMFFSLAQFPSSCKISDQTDKMHKNDRKNKISPVNFEA